MTTRPAILQEYRLSDPQLAAALARGSDVAVTAGAGTGKTRTLVGRYLALLAAGLPLRRIVAVTFTRKAAREMRNRVRAEIGGYLRQPGLSTAEIETWSTYYNELDAARINTIHNICAEILRAHPAEAGTDPRFTILDETQSPLLVLEAVETTLAWAVETEGLEPLFDLLREGQLLDLIETLLTQRLSAAEAFTAYGAAHILEHWQSALNQRQTEAVDEFIQDPDIGEAIQVIRHNQADDAGDRAEVQRQAVQETLRGLDTADLQQRLQALAMLDAINLVGGSQKKWPGGKEQLQEVKNALRTLRDVYRGQKILRLSLNDMDEAIAAAMPAIQRLFDYACSIYQALKEEREALDFDDLEALATKLLAEHEALRAYWQDQAGALLVDEFQDTSEQQRRFIRLLCPDPGKLFIVGDAKQSIYRFRGADVTVFASEKATIETEKGALVDLDTSYRAHERLLESMNRLLGPILGADYPQRPSYVAPFAPLRPGKSTAADELQAPYVEFHLALGTKAEALPRAAAALAERLAQLHHDQGLDFGSMAVLCRASNAFQYYEDAFDAAGIPYLTVAGKGFYDRPEIRDLLNALAAVADPHDDLALTGLLRSPACGLSDPALFRLSAQRREGESLWAALQAPSTLPDAEENQRLDTAVALIRDLNQQAGRMPVADILKRFLDQTHYRASLRRAGLLRALRNVAKLLQDIHNSELVSIDAFLEYQATLRDSGSREGEARAAAGGAVQIMSIHAAKGLEFPLVVLGDAASTPRGSSRITIDPQLGLLLPYKNEEQERATSYELGADLARRQDEAEANRLLYVALTRAEQMLLISGHLSQNRNGRLSWKGWLGRLAEVAGLFDTDLSAYDEEGDGRHRFDFDLDGAALRAAFYEPYYAAQIDMPIVAGEEVGDGTAVFTAMQKPILAGDAAQGEDDQERETRRRIWQIIPKKQSAKAPPWLIGTLTHQALAAWRFPGPGFDAWLLARARGSGLFDDQRLKDALQVVSRLLGRFQEHPLYRQIDSAPRRWHELPFHCPDNGNGRIDLLFQDASGWTLVDFKTDYIHDGEGLQKLLAKSSYVKQIGRYGQAVEQLTGVSPRLRLCLLNTFQGVQIETVQSDDLAESAI